MNLYLFPTFATLKNGYGIAVESDFRRCSPSNKDMVVWRDTNSISSALYVKNDDYIIKQNPFISFASIINTLKRTNRSEVLKSDLSFLKDKDFDYIFCGDVCFYNAIRRIFPNKHIAVRFHNCFARIFDRKHLLKRSLDLVYTITLSNMHHLETRIFNDSMVEKIFISAEDRNYYTLHYGRFNDSRIWNISPKIPMMNMNLHKLLNTSPKLVWFGGVESHKKASVEWFINKVFPKIKKQNSKVEFHLWGKNTERYNNPINSIYGHGFYDGVDSVPLRDALYINPDIIGGGVKMKLLTYLESNVPFISSIFGFEGFPNDLIDGKYCMVVEEEEWVDTIISFINRHYDQFA